MLLKFNKTGKENNAVTESNIVLAGDVGATKTNLTLFKIEANNVNRFT